ncbi:type I-E CRISPR-associated protein Cas6/Cse3/CasE [Rhodococcoides fascians]|uniref:type I-E CRISPR-associated protein Cas6/Cse3/CasE n=1 Tax=Rhodococcoides fascians TaxID=1828 RepID=UPI00068D9265|nr:type I-E CRISPR-associated protein Cas6/Cse3/CasE [Rhodococcus fascians]
MITDIETVALHTSYLTLDARHPEVRRALVDAHNMHRLVMSGWRDQILPTDTEPRRTLGILYTLSLETHNRVRLVVQAKTPPDWHFDAGVLHTSIDQRRRNPPLAGTVAFQLTAAPTKSVPSAPRTDTAPRARGKKIPLPSAERDAWGRKMLAAGGLDVESLTVHAGPRLDSAIKSLPRAHRATPKAVFAHTTVVYTGTAHIMDAEPHIAALTHGVGSAKAYGCGLLLTRSV